MSIKFYQKISKFIPKKLKYIIALDVTAYATTGKYGDTVVPDLTAMESIKRYGDDHGVEL